MQTQSLSRRTFLQHTALAGAAALVTAPPVSLAARGDKLHLATNAYSWQVFYQREGRNFGGSLDAGLKDVAASGLNGFEPGVGGTEDLRALLPLLKKHGLEMRSIYVNSSLHEPAEADRSIEQILATARAVKPFGTRIIVTNPNPLRWGGPENKTDDQLRTQAAAMNRLGKELGALKITLAYHYHDIELRMAAREFHHMLAGTDPRHVTLCLDAHWMYRGAGNSQVALFDVIELYGDRISEVHLRQSQEGVWSETFGPGDIDYEALSAALIRKKVKPHIVLEIAVETGTPKTLDPVEAHRRSAEYARRIFEKMA
ncbi:MAG TPA: sugar phosphate isomerase/epimerase [Verrucomicrobiota bacterium]|nr:sugar phosphate isomerase/epimerase [Verrucomicrobiota bacterium]HRZ36255.1 sugar phosphate isomerase/epimerase [Candidatus Paceibacterota bacterium]HRZ56412.1 sugar phosphate isomerase/epimerase [Candidatus Paceibacterota bacterium]